LSAGRCLETNPIAEFDVSLGSALRRNVVIPLWIARDSSPRLRHYRELMKSQYWSRDELAKLQVRKLRDTLTKAHENTSYYRTLFDSVGFDPRKFTSLDQLTAIPILEKNVLRNRFDDLRSKRHLTGRLTEFKTGGSTGKPTVVIKDSETVELSNGSAYRVFEWAGARLGEPWGLVWGTRRCTPRSRRNCATTSSTARSTSTR
jgi:phenylacetate-CoA ligase